MRNKEIFKLLFTAIIHRASESALQGMQRHMEALKCAEDEEEEQIAKVHAAATMFTEDRLLA